MSLNVIDANHIGSNTNEIEFIIDTSSEVKLFVKVRFILKMTFCNGQCPLVPLGIYTTHVTVEPLNFSSSSQSL